MGDYQRLQTEAEGEVHLNRASHSRHNVYYVKPMTLLHKTAFFASIFACIALVALFLWGLPCDLAQCGEENVNSISWDRTLYGLELKGRMHLVGGTLIAISRSAQWGKSRGVRFPYGGGVVALLGKTGKESYWVQLKELPRYIDCSMSELFANGVRTCLVVGENGYLASIDPISGTGIWKISTPNEKTYPQPKDIDVPIPLPDMDSDGIGDLVTLSRFTKEHHRLAFISGKTGVLIKEPTLSNDCLQVTNLKFDYATSILHYTCSNQIKSRQMSYEVKEVKSKSLKSSLDKIIIPEEEHSRFVEENDSVGEHKVIVSNSGICPNDCAVSVNVTNARNGTIWTYHAQRAYIMSPVSLHFKHSISGFLLKIWEWLSPDKKPTKTADGLSVELINERIILITFNRSGCMHVVNASQTDIIQLCYDNECQPHLSFQTQSALIADLNGDGTQDLISYFVTYKANNDDPLRITDKHSVDQWELESRVRVVRLEAELPKLYEAVSKH